MSEKTYFIEVIESLSLTVGVVAKNKLEALEKLKESYKNEEVVLSSEHYISTEFHVNGCKDNTKR